MFQLKMKTYGYIFLYQWKTYVMEICFLAQQANKDWYHLIIANERRAALTVCFMKTI